MNVRQTISSEFWKQHGNVLKLAREAGVNKDTVRLFLYDDEHNPTLGTLEKLCDALGLELVARKIGGDQE